MTPACSSTLSPSLFVNDKQAAYASFIGCLEGVESRNKCPRCATVLNVVKNRQGLETAADVNE